MCGLQNYTVNKFYPLKKKHVNRVNLNALDLNPSLKKSESPTFLKGKMIDLCTNKTVL
jgi:hypothetical protein